jgi:hypothetical protein
MRPNSVGETTLIVNFGNPVAVGYAQYCQRQHGRHVVILTAREGCEKLNGCLKRMVVFLAGHWTSRHRKRLQTLVAMAHQEQVRRVCVVSTWKVHFEDRAAIRAEKAVLRMLRVLAAPIVILRPSHVISPGAPLSHFHRMCWLLLPFVPGSLTSCSIGEKELFAAIDQELSTPKSCKSRTYTLLGANRPWRTRFLENAPRSCSRYLVALADLLLPLALFRLWLGWFLGLVAERTPRLKAWHTKTLRPRTRCELLALYNPYTYRHVKIVGYNNGVVHFGQRFPGKTIVSTVRCNQRARVWGDLAQFDAGVTIRQAMEVLGSAGRQLPVLPNYSYVSLGTALFIPIHGSASKHSTVAETMEKVVLYDPVRDRFLVARRGESAFGQLVYNLTADLLLLRLVVQTTEQATYFLRTRELINPTSQEIIASFSDNRPMNVEIRKAGSAAATVQVYQYFAEKGRGADAAQELPRDALGRLWDRLEENPVSSFLFHRLTRWLAFHTELFLSEQEFARFWQTHDALPIRKIQLRFIHRDGWPHSPFRDQDCISADLFLLRKDRRRFEWYRKQTLPTVQMNPGKHSM